MDRDNTILIVEDETITARDIKQTVTALGYHVSDTVTNYDDCMQSLERSKPSLLLLDIMLAHSKSGIEIARTVKRTFGIPFIFLTAYSDEQTLQEAMVLEPCGYIIKPFKSQDVKVALFKCFYQSIAIAKEPVTEGMTPLGEGYFYDESNRLLFFNHIPIKLSPKEKRLIEILIAEKGSIVPSRVLEELIWEGNMVSDNALRMLVSRFRMKTSPYIIENVTGIGYRFSGLKKPS